MTQTMRWCVTCQADRLWSSFYEKNRQDYELVDHPDPDVVEQIPQPAGPDYEVHYLLACDQCGHYGYALQKRDERYDDERHPESSLTFRDLTPCSPDDLGLLQHLLDSTVYELLVETLEAERIGLQRLVAMGYRAVIDLAIVKLIGDSGTFKEKLKKLVTEGHLEERNRKLLHTAVEAGNAAAHRAFNPLPKVVKFLKTEAIELTRKAWSCPTLQELAHSEVARAIPPRPR